MARGKSIIPEFMANSPYDTFRLLLPLKLHLDEDKYGNSHYQVIIKNLTKNEIFTYDLSPELLFTHFPIEKSFNNGQSNEYYENKKIEEQTFLIDTHSISENTTKKLYEILDEKSIVSIAGWKRTFLKEAGTINCYLLEQNDKKIIIPHFAVAIYYYFRFSEMREAALECNIDNLYVMCKPDRDDAQIILSRPRTDEDAAFIHRFACQSIAKNAFDNVGKYIHHYLNYMRRLDPDKEVDSIPIKVNFPIREKFNIEAKYSILTNNKTDETFYFIHEILNDNSDIGFDKFTKAIEKNKIISTVDELENLPVIDQEIPDDISEILKVKDATKKYTQTYNKKDKKKNCGSLLNIPIEHKSMKKDTIIDLIKIYQEQRNNESIDQSLTESSKKSEDSIGKVVISSEFEKKEIEKHSLSEIDNFVVFKQYMTFLSKQPTINNFYLSDVKYLPETKREDTDEITNRCKMKGRQRQYVIATFSYENIHVGLLELENYPTSATASWVITSNGITITNEVFNKFITLFLKKHKSTNQLKQEYKIQSLKFTTKNHERNEDLSEKQLTQWLAGLVGKISSK